MFTILLLALVAAKLTTAHMSIFTPAAYGWMNWPDDPQAPLYDLPFEQWWFRGYTNLPTGGEIEELTAGSVWTAQIACHVAWTTYGSRTADADAWPARDACPSGDNAGMYHANFDPNDELPDINGVSGCALAIADKDDIKDVSMDDLTVFSVNQKCVYRRATDFEIPAEMPKCTGSKCICVWFWLANFGQANMYMTGFDCNILQNRSNLKAIGTPQRPLFTGKYPAVTGPKLPFYAYNDRATAEDFGNDHRPGYKVEYGFTDGAQNDIFTGPSIGISVEVPEIASVSIGLIAPPAITTTTTTTITPPSSSAVPTSSPSIRKPSRNSPCRNAPVARQLRARHFGQSTF